MRPLNGGERARAARAVFLETDRLILRPFTACDEDVENLFALDSDPEVMRFLNNGRPHTRTEIVEKVLPHYLEQTARHRGTYGFWAAIERASGAFLGWFHFRPYRHAPEEIELGYRLMRSAWGKGFATEGSRALIRKGFDEYGVDKIVADTLVGNVRSRRVMEALGMTLEAEFTLDEDEFPFWNADQRRGVKYSLTRDRWQAASQRAAGAP